MHRIFRKPSVLKHIIKILKHIFDIAMYIPFIMLGNELPDPKCATIWVSGHPAVIVWAVHNRGNARGKWLQFLCLVVTGVSYHLALLPTFITKKCWVSDVIFFTIQVKRLLEFYPLTLEDLPDLR